jgi:hypothetical protein
MRSAGATLFESSPGEELAKDDGPRRHFGRHGLTRQRPWPTAPNPVTIGPQSERTLRNSFAPLESP